MSKHACTQSPIFDDNIWYLIDDFLLIGEKLHQVDYYASRQLGNPIGDHHSFVNQLKKLLYHYGTTTYKKIDLLTILWLIRKEKHSLQKKTTTLMLRQIRNLDRIPSHVLETTIKGTLLEFLYLYLIKAKVNVEFDIEDLPSTAFLSYYAIATNNLVLTNKLINKFTFVTFRGHSNYDFVPENIVELACTNFKVNFDIIKLLVEKFSSTIQERYNNLQLPSVQQINDTLQYNFTQCSCLRNNIDESMFCDVKQIYEFSLAVYYAAPPTIIHYLHNNNVILPLAILIYRETRPLILKLTSRLTRKEDEFNAIVDLLESYVENFASYIFNFEEEYNIFIELHLLSTFTINTIQRYYSIKKSKTCFDYSVKSLVKNPNENVLISILQEENPIKELKKWYIRLLFYYSNDYYAPNIRNALLYLSTLSDEKICIDNPKKGIINSITANTKNNIKDKLEFLYNIFDEKPMKYIVENMYSYYVYGILDHRKLNMKFIDVYDNFLYLYKSFPYLSHICSENRHFGYILYFSEFITYEMLIKEFLENLNKSHPYIYCNTIEMANIEYLKRIFNPNRVEYRFDLYIRDSLGATAKTKQNFIDFLIEHEYIKNDDETISKISKV